MTSRVQMGPFASEPALPWARTRREWFARGADRSAVAGTPSRATETTLSHRVAWSFIVIAVVAWPATFWVGFRVPLTILNVAALAAAVAGLRHPGVGLLGIGVLCVLEPISGHLLANGGLWRWNTLNYWLLFVLAAFLPMVPKLLRDTHTRWVVALAAIMTYGLLDSFDLLVGVQSVLNMLAAVSLVICCERARRDRHAWLMLGLVNGLIGALGALVYVLQLSVLPPLNRNVWCLFPLVALCSVCLAFRFATNPREQVALGVLAVVNLTWTFLSASRGGFVTGLLCVLFLFFQLPGVTRRMAVVAIGAITAVALVSQLAPWQENALTRLTETLDDSKSASERTSNRSDIALAGWRIFLNNPGGVGTGSFGHANSELALFSWSRSTDVAAHSGWIRVLAENGVAGIVALIAYVFSFAVAGWRQRARGVLSIGLFVTALFALLLVSYEFEYQGFWLVAAGFGVMLRVPPVERRRPTVTRLTWC